MDRIHEVHVVEKNLKGVYVVLREIDMNSSKYQTWECVALVHVVEKNLKGVYVVLREIDMNSSTNQTWECVALKFGPKLEKPLKRERKARIGKREAKTR